MAAAAWSWVEKMLQLAQRTSARAQVEPALAELWFELNTRRLDAMQEVAQHLVLELRARCAKSIAQAQADLDSHRKLSRRLAELDREPSTPLLFSLTANPLGEARPGEGQPGILELLHEQTRRLHEVEAELQETRRSLVERKLLERAKQQLMQQLQLPEADAPSICSDWRCAVADRCPNWSGSYSARSPRSALFIDQYWPSCCPAPFGTLHAPPRRTPAEKRPLTVRPRSAKGLDRAGFRAWHSPCKTPVERLALPQQSPDEGVHARSPSLPRVDAFFCAREIRKDDGRQLA